LEVAEVDEVEAKEEAVEEAVGAVAVEEAEAYT